MAEFVSVLKMFVFTLLIIMVMQIRIGDQTVEEQSLSWINHSAVGSYLTDVVDGGVKAIRDGYHKVKSRFSPVVQNSMGENPNAVGSRHLKFKIERSEKALHNHVNRSSVEAQSVSNLTEPHPSDADSATTVE